MTRPILPRVSHVTDGSNQMGTRRATDDTVKALATIFSCFPKEGALFEKGPYFRERLPFFISQLWLRVTNIINNSFIEKNALLVMFRHCKRIQKEGHYYR